MKKYCALGLLLLLGGLSGCAGLSQVKSSYIELAQEQLHKMGGFYDYLVDQKAVPDNKQAATQVLMGLDLAADIYKSVLAGSPVDADKLQEAAVLTATGNQVAAQMQGK
jgi:hypothetical protein